MTRIAVVVGNPKPASRTLGVALAVADAVAAGLASPADRLVIDLAEHAADMFDPSARALGAAGAAVAASEVVVVASPTYKASYTGLLKAFFDRYGSNGLLGVVALPVMTGAAPVHALAVEVHLRPLLIELGATAPTRGLYVVEAQLAELDAVVAAWAAAAVPRVVAALSIP